jgi:CheY-like chemotaxis protein
MINHKLICASVSTQKQKILSYMKNSLARSYYNMSNFDPNRLIAVDTIKVDDHVRLTLTRKVRHIFPINAGDILGIYQDKYNNDELVFKIQRDKEIVDSWVVKRKYVGGINKNNSGFASIASENGARPATSKLARPMLHERSNEDLNETRNSVYAGTRNKLANILLIDDEEDVLYSFNSVLLSKGYDVKPFRESKEALRYLFGLKNGFSLYDLAIIDIRMPDINGIQFYQILKIMNKNINVLFISALDAIEEALTAFPEIKLDNILRKPTSQTLLLEKVNDILTQ